MSKRFGNVINPDDIVERFGADSLRVYEMFMGPFDQSIAWSTDGLVGAKRFLEKVWRIAQKSEIRSEKSWFDSAHHPEPVEGETNPKSQIQNSKRNNQLRVLLHQTIGKVTKDIEAFKFNTAISALMILVNAR